MTNKKDVPETARDVPTVEVTVEYLDSLAQASWAPDRPSDRRG